MKEKKIILYITDIGGSVFGGDLKELEKVFRSLEKNFDVDVKVSFVTGGSLDFYLNTATPYIKKACRSFFKRSEFSIIDGILIQNDNIKTVLNNKEKDDKIEEIECLLDIYGKRNIAGIIFVGDSKEDYDTFPYINDIDRKLQLGTFTVAVFSNNDEAGYLAASKNAKSRAILEGDIVCSIRDYINYATKRIGEQIE